tara:strand:- start:530 stop:1735 length:1206 start_codon:yes stop_codon:yes gene_type:complete
MLFNILKHNNLWLLWLQIIGWGCSTTMCSIYDKCNFFLKPCESEETISSPTNSDYNFTFEIEEVNEEPLIDKRIATLKAAYTFMVSSVLLFKPLVLIYKRDEGVFDILIAQLSFEIIPILIYYFGMFYFGSDHFNDHYNKGGSLINNYIVGISFISSSIALIYHSTKYHTTLLNIYYNFYIFFALSILITYLCVFNMVFCHHKRYLIQIKNKIINNNNIPINNIIIEIQRFKRELNHSVHTFENMFNLTSICGGLSCALIINRLFIINDTKNKLLIKPLIVVYIILFWIIQIIFYYTASSVFYFQERINEALNNSHFTETCLKRNNKGSRRNRLTFQKECITYLDETSTTIDWLVLSKTLTQNFCHFKVLGVNIHKWQSFERIIVILAFIGIVHSSNVKFS